MRNFGSNLIPRQPEQSRIETEAISLKIQQRRASEQAAATPGGSSFEAVKSNNEMLPNQPAVQVADSKKTSAKSMDAGRRADEIVCAGLRAELGKHGLLPDGGTFYLIDFGLPHAPALQETLLELGIDPSIFVQPSKSRLENSESKGYYQRYIDSYHEKREHLFDLRAKLAKPRGYALMISSHADAPERAKQKKILPSAERLKEMGVRKIVIGKETYYQEPKTLGQLQMQSGMESSEHLFLNHYAKQLNDAGLEVFVIGFDYRRKPTAFENFDPQYKPAGIEVFDWGYAQNIAGKRMVFDKKSGKVCAIQNNQEIQPSNEEIVAFRQSLSEINLTAEESQRLEVPLPEK
jgi:hypothetical protein